LNSKFILLALIGFLFFGCANKQKFNQSDEFWYKQIVKYINQGNLDKADESFSSLEAEHINSPFLETAILILIQTHIQIENYLIADYYMNRYNRLFGTKESKSYIEYLRIKSKYMAFKQPKRDQKLLLDTLDLIEQYISTYSNSQYIPYIRTMQTNLKLSQFSLNKDIVVLYQKLDKPKAVEFYKENTLANWIDEKNIQEPEPSFIRSLFE